MAATPMMKRGAILSPAQEREGAQCPEHAAQGPEVESPIARVPAPPFPAQHRHGAAGYGGKPEEEMDSDNAQEDRVG